MTGQPAIQHDLDPVLASDLRRGEAVALPIALAVLVVAARISAALAIPFLFAACTIAATLAAVYALAHALQMVTFVTNLVELIGIGIAIDYSLLVVHRFREELGARERADRRGRRADDGDGRPRDRLLRADRLDRARDAAADPGAVHPLARRRRLPDPARLDRGVPDAAAGAAVGLRSARPPPDRAPPRRERLLGRLATSIMRRPWRYLLAGTAVLLAAAAPVVSLHLTPGSLSGDPRLDGVLARARALRERVAAGAVTPIEVVVDAGAPGAARSRPRARGGRAAERPALPRPGGVRRRERPAAAVRRAGRALARVIVVARHDYGDAADPGARPPPARRLVGAAGFPPGARRRGRRRAGAGRDFLERSYAHFPWLVLAVLATTYLVLLRAFRSLLLPLKAVILNALSVAAACGLLVVVFRWGAGAHLLGLYHLAQIDGWVPIFLFATLFGLSMDYEVFLVTRMREAWDERGDNAQAVALGLERRGRVVTAAAAIMVAAFFGFVLGHVAGLQELGVGLAFAVALDATVIRMILVPSLMAILGRWNWWLPARVGRIARIALDEDLAVQLRAALGPAGDEADERAVDLDLGRVDVEAEQRRERHRLLARVVGAQVQLASRSSSALGEQLVDPVARRVHLEPVAGVRRDERAPARVLLDAQLPLGARA